MIENRDQKFPRGEERTHHSTTGGLCKAPEEDSAQHPGRTKYSTGEQQKRRDRGS